MDILHQLEITIILWIQSVGSWLAGPMRSVSLLGNEEFYLLIMPALYWSIDGVLGLRMALILLLTTGFNTAFKIVFHSPRPYWYDLRVQALSTETSFGLPSGHSQHSASIWGLAATAAPGKWAKGFFILLIFLIGFSRILLGVHFISDVVLGWIIGGLLLWAYLKIEKPIWARVRSLSLPQMVTLALVSAIALMLVILSTTALLGGWEMPDEWKQNALTAAAGNVINPLSLDGAFTLPGTWFGMLSGAAWMYHKYGGFNAAGTPKQRVLRYWVGVIGVFVFWYGLGAVFPRNPDALSYALRFFRYTLIGLWISVIAPLIFQRIGLLTVQKETVPSFSSRENPL